MTEIPDQEQKNNRVEELQNPYQSLARNARTNPTGYFALSKDAATTNQQADLLVRQLSTEFARLGVKPGDLIAVDVPEVLSLIFLEAAMFHGAVSAEIPRGEISETIGFKFSFSITKDSPYHPQEARQVFVDQKFMERVSSHPPASSAHVYTSLNAPIRVAFTSGTTGRPKAIELSLGGYRSITQRGVNLWMEHLPTITQMGSGTLFGVVIFMVHVESDCPMMLLRDATVEQSIVMGQRIGVRSIKGAPSQISAIASEAERLGITLGQIESIFVAGAPMSMQARDNVRRAVPNAKFLEIYGSSEVLLITEKYDEDGAQGYVGKPSAGVAVQVVDENGRGLPPNEVGELRVRTPWMISGYLGSPGAFERHVRDGWFYPGDLAFLREDGGLVLAGRASEVLNAGGVKVDPIVIEEAALQTGHIADCAAFIVRDEGGLDHFALAYRALESFKYSDFASQLRSQLGAYCPRTVFEVEEIPYNSAGKLMRRELSQIYSKSA